METLPLTLTPVEADALLKLIDLAVKAGGMQVAEAGVPVQATIDLDQG